MGEHNPNQICSFAPLEDGRDRLRRLILAPSGQGRGSEYSY